MDVGIIICRSSSQLRSRAVSGTGVSGMAGDEMQSLVSAVLLCPFTVLLQFRRGDKNFDWECTRHATLLHLLHCSLVRGGRGPPRKPVLESGTRSG